MVKRAKRTRLQAEDLHIHLQHCLDEKGFTPEAPEPRLAWAVFCESFDWPLSNQLEVLNFSVETGEYDSEDKHYFYLILTSQFHFIDEANSNSYRVGVDMRFPPGAFPQIGQQCWWLSSKRDLDEVTSHPGFKQLLASKPTAAFIHWDDG